MLKETGYQEKFKWLRPYLPSIIEVVKKDLKNEHWKIDRAFCQKYFVGKGPSNVSNDVLAAAYAQEIEEGNLGLGEFIATRWLLKNTDLYAHFEASLKSIDEEFDEITELSADQSRLLLEGAVKEYGWGRTFLFSVLNSVVFPKAIFDQLEAEAQKEMAAIEKNAQQEEEERTIEALKKRHERELRAQKERYEKKLSGLQKKYLHDIAKLKNA